MVTYETMANFLLIPFLLALGSLSQLATASTVPMLVWSNNVETKNPPFTSLVDLHHSNDILANYVANRDEKISIIALIQKNLDVEQFTANNAPFISKLFSNANLHPLFFTNVLVSKGEEGIYSFNDEPSLEQMRDDQKIRIDLLGENLEENDKVIQTTFQRFNDSKPTVFILTGERNEMPEKVAKELDGKHRERRDAADDSKSKVISLPKNEPCLFFYSTKASFIKYKMEGKDIKNYTTEYDSISGNEADCSNIEKAENGKMDRVANSTKLELKGKSATATVEFVFQVSPTSAWEITDLTVTADGTYSKSENTTYSLSTEVGFSYSCQRSVFRLIGSDVEYAELVFQRFQIQPFHIKDSNKLFETSFDCSVWFTIPIFSCLLVILLLLTILYFGVRALMSISTPDRFENPKGRALIITNFEE